MYWQAWGDGGDSKPLKAAHTAHWLTGPSCASAVSIISMSQSIPSRGRYSRRIHITETKKHFFFLETVFPDPVEIGFSGILVHKSYFLPSSSWPCMTVTAMPWLSVSHRPLCWFWMRPLLLLIPSQLHELLFHSSAGAGVCGLPSVLRNLQSPTALYNFIINKKLNR